jgi:hypothetical protein
MDVPGDDTAGTLAGRQGVEPGGAGGQRRAVPAQPERLGVTLLDQFGRLALLGLIEQVRPPPAPRTRKGRGTDRQQQADDAHC